MPSRYTTQYGVQDGVAGASLQPRSELIAASRAQIESQPVRCAVALACALALAFAFACSAFTVAEDFHHDCTGDGCAVCAQIAGCLHIARGGIALAGIGTLAAILSVRWAPFVAGPERRAFDLSDLFTLKARLND